MADKLLGRILDGRYKLLELVGAGGMGAVYKAREIALDRIVAVKIMKGEIDQEGLARFEREGKILASLSHPNIMNFYLFGTAADGVVYLSTEFLQGETLRSILSKEKTLAWRRTAILASRICDALGFAHDNGIVHRDLKPENIMLMQEPQADFVKVLDFGLARIIPSNNAELQKLTKTGHLLGTVNYLSPEQCSGQKADSRSDVYALGCVLYEALLGQILFQADDVLGVFLKHATEAPRDFAEFSVSAEIPRELEAIVSKSLQKDPAARYQTMYELKNAIDNLLACPAEELSFAREKAKRAKGLANPLLSAMAIVFVLFTGIGILRFFATDAKPPDIPKQKKFIAGVKPETEKQTERRLAGLRRLVSNLKKDLARTNDAVERERIQTDLIRHQISICSACSLLHLSAESAQAYKQAIEFCSAQVRPQAWWLLEAASSLRAAGELELAREAALTALKMVKSADTRTDTEAQVNSELANIEIQLHNFVQARSYFALSGNFSGAANAFNSSLPKGAQTPPFDQNANRIAACWLLGTGLIGMKDAILVINKPEEKLAALALLNDCSETVLNCHDYKKAAFLLSNAREMGKKMESDSGLLPEINRTNQLASKLADLQ